ncbi:RNase H [Novymonas esmeraldas]|uniref:RNase H n=1 Tax=Novymonas esmeraldas TaxID=1808958 RepID=A0AAW0EXS9_9TRYP
MATPGSYAAPKAHQPPPRLRRAHLHTTLPGGLRADSPEAEKPEASQRRLSRCSKIRDSFLCKWRGPHANGRAGGAAVLHDKGFQVATARVSCEPPAFSHRTGCEAMEAGLTPPERQPQGDRVGKTSAAVVGTDSLSLLMALSTGPATVTDGILRRIWTRMLALTRRHARLSFQFVNGHCGLAKNEKVDKLAKSAMSEQPATRTSITDFVRGLRRQGDTPRHHTVRDDALRKVMPGHNVATKKNGQVTLTRQRETMLAQLFTGTSARLGFIHRRVTGGTGTGCRWRAAHCDVQARVHTPPARTVATAAVRHASC